MSYLLTLKQTKAKLAKELREINKNIKQALEIELPLGCYKSKDNDHGYGKTIVYYKLKSQIGAYYKCTKVAVDNYISISEETSISKASVLEWCKPITIEEFDIAYNKAKEVNDKMKLIHKDCRDHCDELVSKLKSSL